VHHTGGGRGGIETAFGNATTGAWKLIWTDNRYCDTTPKYVLMSGKRSRLVVNNWTFPSAVEIKNGEADSLPIEFL
jgi:hypothetical protein